MTISRKLAILAVISTLAATACNGGRGQTAAEQFVTNLNNSDAYRSYYLVKDPTRQPGYIVVKEDDGSYWGIDIRNADQYYDIDLFNANAFPVYANVNGYYEDAYGNLFEKTTEVSKDLEKVGAVISKLRARDIAQDIAANYGLSENKALELGTLLVEYKDLKKTRALTQVDDDRFLNSALGISSGDINRAYDSYSRGDVKDMNDLIEKSASSLGTTPEHMRSLVESTLTQSSGN